MMKSGKSEKIPVVLVGLGKMGRNHLRVILENENFILKGIVDPVIPSRELADYPSVKIFHSLNELDESRIDYSAAVIATPTETHFEICLELLKRNKHVLVEKPLSLSPEHCSKLIEEAKVRDLVLAVGHLERYNPAVLKLKEIITSGQLGDPIHFSVTRVGGYPRECNARENVLLDLAIHDIDVLRQLIGRLRIIGCYCHTTIKKDVFDTAEILLANEKGVSASIHVNWITPTKIRTLRMTGTRGVVFVDYILQTCELLGGDLIGKAPHLKEDFKSLLEQYRNPDRISFGIQKQEPLKLEHVEFYKAISRKGGEICTGEEGLAAVILAQQALGSFNNPHHHLSYY